MKRDKIIYWVATGLFSLMLTGGAMMYFFDHQTAVDMFTVLGYPAYIIYPMGVMKLLGVAGILQNKSDRIKQWAYFGFIINLSLAILSHAAIGDGEAFGPAMPLALLVVSIVFDARLKKAKA